ncbi:dimethylargininase [Micropruina sonneratiae]|uniref:dimethylargininase n=1 Tax=Micropruina sonneratiae TaxID=2986940 RepID=UPI002226DB68|nr:dimethylargininase [Micropruina sp. KQZ13P-5]MCW3158716.1 N(G),N(G)-dimethylarginine dimethylaminohydrolase [Micropruina sp. KQZ13P-5]
MFQQRALVRPPSPRLAEGLLTHLERVPVDAQLATRQWADYRSALHDNGWETLLAPAADECPDGVFIEDTMVVYGDLAVITRPGAVSRRLELPGAELAIRTLGYRTARITDPGTLDGGDVLKHDRTVWVGIGGRTNTAGADQLARLLAPLGARVVPVTLTKVLHLKSAATALPDGTVLGHPDFVDDPAVFPHFLAVPEPEGAHVVSLNDGRLLISAAAPRTTEQLAALGYTMVPVDISEFEKLEGCVTCLSVRLRGV